MSRVLKWINHEKVLYALDECSKVYKTATQSNHFSVKHEQRADLYWLLISYFFPPLCLSWSINQAIGQTTPLIQPSCQKRQTQHFSSTHMPGSSPYWKRCCRERWLNRVQVHLLCWTAARTCGGTDLLTASLPVNGRRTSSKIMWGRTYNAQRKVTLTFGIGCALCAI